MLLLGKDGVAPAARRPAASTGRELTCTIVTCAGPAATAGHGGSAREGPPGPRVDQPAGVRAGELVSPVLQCRRSGCSALVARLGRQVAGKPPWGGRAEPQRAEIGAGRMGYFINICLLPLSPPALDTQSPPLSDVILVLGLLTAGPSLRRHSHTFPRSFPAQGPAGPAHSTFRVKARPEIPHCLPHLPPHPLH